MSTLSKEDHKLMAKCFNEGLRVFMDGNNILNVEYKGRVVKKYKLKNDDYHPTKIIGAYKYFIDKLDDLI